MLPTIKANLIVTGLQAVEKAEQSREEASRVDSPPVAGQDQSSLAGITYSSNANGSRITLTDPARHELGSLLDCCV